MSSFFQDDLAESLQGPQLPELRRLPRDTLWPRRTVFFKPLRPVAGESGSISTQSVHRMEIYEKPVVRWGCVAKESAFCLDAAGQTRLGGLGLRTKGGNTPNRGEEIVSYLERPV